MRVQPPSGEPLIDVCSGPGWHKRVERESTRNYSRGAGSWDLAMGNVRLVGNPRRQKAHLMKRGRGFGAEPRSVMERASSARARELFAVETRAGLLEPANARDSGGLCSARNDVGPAKCSSAALAPLTAEESHSELPSPPKRPEITRPRAREFAKFTLVRRLYPAQTSRW